MTCKWIEPKLYKRIKEVMPIFCVDVAVINDSGKVLLLKRTNDPAKGEDWVAGGRVLKGEPMVKAARRKLLQETGIVCDNIAFAGVIDALFEEVHMPVVVFVAKYGMGAVKLDSQHSSYKWVDIKDITINKGYHKYLVEEIELVRSKVCGV